jgi:metal-responsive CopG/Arc/MetJ family transcriptional regulator
VNVKKRVSFLIDPELFDRLHAMRTRTGLSDSEQIREAIRMWLDSREWPPRRQTRNQLHGDQGTN